MVFVRVLFCGVLYYIPYTICRFAITATHWSPLGVSTAMVVDLLTILYVAVVLQAIDVVVLHEPVTTHKQKKGDAHQDARTDPV